MISRTNIDLKILVGRQTLEVEILNSGICQGAIDNPVDKGIGNWKLKCVGEKKKHENSTDRSLSRYEQNWFKK